MLIDTHCHIHEADFPIDAELAIANAHNANVQKMICAGTNLENSRRAIEFANSHEGIFASVGVHPHYAKEGLEKMAKISELVDSARSSKQFVAIGEVGLDYHYDLSPRDVQMQILREQIKLAQKYDLPVIFHVREAFDDFWSIFDELVKNKPIRGVLHCFTDDTVNAEEGVKRGLFFGVNGIATFTKIESQKEMFVSLPLDRILLETDAPLLTPSPLRGKVKVNEPAYIKEIGEYVANSRGISLDEVAQATMNNASSLFNL